MKSLKLKRHYGALPPPRLGISQIGSRLINGMSVAHVDDIFDALKRLDALDKLPEVAACNLNRLPDRQPEELNLLRIVRVAELEKCRDQHADTLSTLSIDILKIKENERSYSRAVAGERPAIILSSHRPMSRSSEVNGVQVEFGDNCDSGLHLTQQSRDTTKNDISKQNETLCRGSTVRQSAAPGRAQPKGGGSKPRLST